MVASDDKSSVGPSEPQVEASLGRIGDDVQRAKQNISGAAAAARDDIAAELRQLSADFVSLRDTVAALAKTVAVQVGEAETRVVDDIATTAKAQAGTLLVDFR